MLGVNPIIMLAVMAIVTATSDRQVNNLVECQSLVTLKALKGLLHVGMIGDGSKSGKDHWLGKKAQRTLDSRITYLMSLYDQDDIEVECETEGHGAETYLPKGFTPPDAWESEAGKGIPDRGDASEQANPSPESGSRESAAAMQARLLTVSPHAEGSRAVFQAELDAERAHEKGQRKGVVKYLQGRIVACERFEGRIAAANAKTLAQAAKVEARAVASAEAAQKRAERAERKAERDAKKAADMVGVVHLPITGDVDLAAERVCPKCHQVKNVGEDFGVRITSRLVWHRVAGKADDPLYADGELYVRAVKKERIVQSHCKACRKLKPEPVTAWSGEGHPMGRSRTA